MSYQIGTGVLKKKVSGRGHHGDSLPKPLHAMKLALYVYVDGLTVVEEQ